MKQMIEINKHLAEQKELPFHFQQEIEPPTKPQPIEPAIEEKKTKSVTSSETEDE